MYTLCSLSASVDTQFYHNKKRVMPICQHQHLHLHPIIPNFVFVYWRGGLNAVTHLPCCALGSKFNSCIFSFQIIKVCICWPHLKEPFDLWQALSQVPSESKEAFKEPGSWDASIKLERENPLPAALKKSDSSFQTDYLFCNVQWRLKFVIVHHF